MSAVPSPTPPLPLKRLSMTPEDWLGADTLAGLRNHISVLSDRKLHLFTAGLLRRVWEDLPSDHTRLVVEATEQFADGR
jgi:hypothetical protein